MWWLFKRLFGHVRTSNTLIIGESDKGIARFYVINMLSQKMLKLSFRVCISELMLENQMSFLFRAAIFKIHLQGLKTELDKAELARKMATVTPGFAGFKFYILLLNKKRFVKRCFWLIWVTFLNETYSLGQVPGQFWKVFRLNWVWFGKVLNYEIHQKGNKKGLKQIGLYRSWWQNAISLTLKLFLPDF